MIKMRRSNLQSFCRTCLEHLQSTSATNFNISQTPDLTKLLIVCTSLNINEDTDAVYPQSLCRKCYDTMQQFREFREMAQQSAETLRKIVMEQEEEEKNIDTISAIDEDGFFNDTSDSVNPGTEIKIEFEAESLQESNLTNKTIDPADEFANDSDSCAPTTSSAKKRKIDNMDAEKFLCKFYGCNAEFKTLQSLDDHIASQHATAVPEVLKKIVENQQKFDERISKIELNMVEKSEMLAQNKILRKCKVTMQKIEHSVCRMEGELKDKNFDKISDMLPFETVDVVFNAEQELKTVPEFNQAMATYLHTVKGVSEDVGCVLKMIFTDQVLEKFNWDGRWEKRALNKLHLVDTILRDIFKEQGSSKFEKSLKKAIERSHHRMKQKKYQRKKSGIMEK